MTNLNTNSTTLTNRVAAIQVKMLHLQFRMKKIYYDQALLFEKSKNFSTNRETIKGFNNAAYSLIDMLVSMEHMYQLMKDFFATKELTQYFDRDTYKLLNSVKKVSEKWKFVRNKLGGHLDSEMVEKMCQKHNYKGVFLSNDLESDLGVLNMLLIEEAINESRTSHDIFGRDLNMKNNISGEVKVLVEKLNEDWTSVFAYFNPMMELLYKVGKKEKVEAT
ncbi:MAG: hypothetical protein AB4372_13010, partial [Xenococcus sp. (in: cyanobacteria)]